MESHKTGYFMDHDEVQSPHTDKSEGSMKRHVTNSFVPAIANRRTAPLQPFTGGETDQEMDPIHYTLTILQRQQREQTTLIRQLLQEVEGLKQNQVAQGTTVSKLDRRLQRARLWRLCGLLLRWSLVAAGVGMILYFVGMEQVLAYWERLLWLLT